MGERSQATGVESGEREVMMAPNNIEFFYAAEERSERIWRIDERLNTMYKYLVRFVVTASCVAIGLHLKSKKDMRSAAQQVVVEIDKEGAKATVDGQGAVVIYMDGKVQQVLPPDEKRIDDSQASQSSASRSPDKIAKGNLLARHIAKQIQLLMAMKGTDNGRRDFEYYASMMKPELKQMDEHLYAKIMHKDSILLQRPCGAV